MRATSRELRCSSTNPGCAARCAIDEQPHRFGAHQLRGRRLASRPQGASATARARRSRRSPAGARDSWRAPADRDSRAASASARCAQAATRWSQLSSTISASYDASAAISASTPLTSRAGARPSAAATASAITPAFRDRGELDQPDAVAEVVPPPRGHLEAEPRLAAPCRPRERDQRSAAQQPRELIQLLLPADEGRQLDGQVVAARRRRSRAGPAPSHGSRAPRGGRPARLAPAPSRPRRDPRAGAARGTAPARPRRDRRRA